MKIQITKPLWIHERGGRAQFEDYIFPEPQNVAAGSRLFIVADAGPGNQGRTAAELAAQNLAEYFEISPPAGDVDDAYMEKALGWVEEALSSYIQSNPGSKGMNTTIALVHAGENLVTIGWVGDSRVYYYDSQKKKLEVTEDHSVVNDLVQRGKIRPEEAGTHKDRYRLLRAIQSSENPTQMDTRFLPVKDLNPGDFFLICSDGLLESLSNEDIKTLFDNIAEPQGIIDEIRHLSQGNRDSYSCYLLPVTAVNAPAPLPAATQQGAGTSVSMVTEPSTAPALVQETPGLLSRDLVIYSVIGVLALALIFLVYWALQDNRFSYESLVTRGNESMRQGLLSQAVAQYDSAYRQAGDPRDKERALRLSERASRWQHLGMIEALDAENTYPGYMQALDLTEYAIEHFGDEQDTLYKLSKRLDEKIASIKAAEAFPQLLAEAARLCEEGKSELAETYFAEADKFDEGLKSERLLSDAKKACIDAYAQAEARPRPVEEAPKPVDQGISRSLAQREATTDPATPSTEDTPASTTSPLPDPAQTSTESTATAATSGTPGQMKDMERGKALYTKAGSTQSNYEFKKAADYLKSAGSALDAEGYYMLARMYHKGLGVNADLKKSLEYARQSALKGYPDGHFLYAHLLLLRLNPGDTLTAKKSLRIAADKGSKDAELRLRLIQP